MIDFLLDPSTKDFNLEEDNVGIKLTNAEQAYQQSIRMGLSLNLGEFFTHTNYGLPWLRNKDYTVGQGVRYFLGDNFPNPEIFITRELDIHLKNISFVKEVTSSYEFNSSTRCYTYTFTVQVNSGEIIEFAPYKITL
ncbi:putative baseplate component [Vibrio phage 424E50-1]|nr:putative baseplate component [Vibrio phage 424E50-1]